MVIVNLDKLLDKISKEVPLKIKLNKWVEGIVVLILVAVIFFVIAACFGLGWRVLIVQSGSMEPTLKTGGVAFTRPIAINEIRQGDIISLKKVGSDTIITHRVIDVVEGDGGLWFQTKGDANKEPDQGLTSQVKIVNAQKVMFHVPSLGYTLDFLNTSKGRMAMISIIGLIILGFILWEIYKSSNKRKAVH
jgi:signal peptidase I